MNGWRGLLFSLLAFTLVGCGGCSPLYVLEGAVVQGRILLSREPVVRVLRDPELPEAQRAKLELLLEARAFAARGMGLEVGDAYGSYAEVPEGALVWVVSAARQTRLESYTWWFPIVGSVTYKGFFEKSDAESLARDLQEEGWDTYMRPSGAFSTLGWFDDPILSNWLRRDDVALVDLLLHELTHRSFYRSGHTDFNESFASWAGRAGAYAFFRDRDGAEAANTQLALKRLQESFQSSARWGAEIEKLEEFYLLAARQKWPRAKILEERREVYRVFGDPDRVNNAVILARWAYRRDLSDFRCAQEATGAPLREVLASTWSQASASADPFAAIRCQDDGGQRDGAPAGRS